MFPTAFNLTLSGVSDTSYEHLYTKERGFRTVGDCGEKRRVEISPFMVIIPAHVLIFANNGKCEINNTF